MAATSDPAPETSRLSHVPGSSPATTWGSRSGPRQVRRVRAHESSGTSCDHCWARATWCPTRHMGFACSGDQRIVVPHTAPVSGRYQPRSWLDSLRSSAQHRATGNHFPNTSRRQRTLRHATVRRHRILGTEATDVLAAGVRVRPGRAACPARVWGSSRYGINACVPRPPSRTPPPTAEQWSCRSRAVG